MAIKRKVKPKPCAVCEQPFTPMFTTTQQVCSTLCAMKYNSPEEIEKRYQTLKVESRKLSWYEEIARKVFQKWIRMRDALLPCISCGRTFTHQWDGGHYFKAEIFSGLIFDEDNCHKQCSECNGDNMHGNITEYRKGLVKRYGEDFVKRLEARSDANRQKSWTREEYMEITEKYKHKLKLLK